VMMLIAFFFLLTDGHRLLAWVEYASPLRDGQTRELIDEFRHTSRSILTSLLATALVQGAAATAGYYIARVPQALFFGVITFFAAFIPSVGTAVVALPLAGLLLLLGHKWAALFLAAWALVVVGLVDNVVKPILISRGGGVHLNGVVVFFSLVGGIAIFGAIGLIAGPLVATFLTAVVRLGKRDFPAPRTV
jgi:predicted PurR-regulated permease PerM